MDLPKAWIEAGASGMCAAKYGDMAWGKLGDFGKEHWMREATSCLAAVFERAEVVFTSKYDGHDVECDCGVGAPGFTLNAGDTLTPAQGCVYAHLVRGLTVKESAEELGVIPKTVENHRCEVLRRLEIETTAKLIVWHFTEFVPFVRASEYRAKEAM